MAARACGVVTLFRLAEVGRRPDAGSALMPRRFGVAATLGVLKGAREVLRPGPELGFAMIPYQRLSVRSD